MSYVPQRDLKSVNSRELRTFTITENLTDKTFPYSFDSATNYMAFCREATIRNISGQSVIYYRTEPGAVYDVIPPNSERTVEGWFSLMQIREAAGQSINGVIVFELVKFEDAFNNAE